MARPVSSLLVFPLLALGIFIGSQSLFNPWHLFAAFLLLFLFWSWQAYRFGAKKSWVFWLIMSIGTVALGQLSILPTAVWSTSERDNFTGSVYAVQHLSFDTRVLVRLPSRAQVAVHLPKNTPIALGSTLAFSGIIEEPRQAPNPGVFCYRDYLRRLGVFGVCYPEDYVIEKKTKVSRLQSLQAWMRRNLTDHVRDPGLALAMVLGERDELGTKRKDIWRLLGISHLLAISGMHVGFVALGLGLAAQRLPLRPAFKLLLIQGILLLYIVVAGNGASAWRALLVSVLGGYAAFRGFVLNPLQLWAAAGWLILLSKPTLLFDLGFGLSFAASGGILLWGSSVKIRVQSKIVGYILNSLAISTIAQITLAPLLLGSFGEIALLGPIATLVFLPLVVVLLIGGLLTALGLGSLGLGQLLNGAMGLVEALESMLVPVAWQWKLGNLSLFEVYLWWGLFIYGGWRLKRPRLTKPRQTYACLITLFVVLLFVMSLPSVVRRPLEVTAVNVGQGDCYYLRTPSGKHILIDGGGDSLYWQQRGKNVGKERLVPYLLHRQVPRLDYVVLSHPHEDHLFGLLAVLEDFEIGMVIDNGHTHTSPTYERYLELLLEKNIPYKVVSAGERLRLGDGISLNVLYPDHVRPQLPSAHNNNSLLLRLDFGGMRLLFTGDLEAAVLYDMAHDPSLDLRAQWLKIPHHGSRGSLLEEFYQKVNPAWAVISVGQNSFAHPHQEVLDMLAKLGINWRTTEGGPETFRVWWGLWGRFLRSSS